MASELFAWDNGVADSTASQVASLGEELKSNLTALVSQINAAKAADTWDGIEESEFRQIFGNWEKAADAVFGVLNGVSKLVDGANEAVKSYREEIQKALD